MQWTLAGKIVSNSKKARAILRAAIRDGKQYLIPQARSVARQLEAVGK